MALINWSDSYSVKVKQFDDQHKKLISMVNELHDSMKIGKGKEILGKILTGLVQYTELHFRNEEQLMKQHGYPGYENHKKEHNMLVVQVSDLHKQHQQGNTPITQNVLLFLKEWLNNHIQGEDRNYGPFLNGKGIK
jgi:hemerythrin